MDGVNMHNVEYDILNDEHFSNIRYKKYKFNSASNFDKKSFACSLPFNNVEIQSNGDVYVCCPAWNPAIIGNLLEEDLESIWSGNRANAVRESIKDTSFRYCQENLCPAMLSGEGNHIIARDKFKAPVIKFPNYISLSIDNTCNLECPSCRFQKILKSSPAQHDKSLKIMENIFDVIFREPHNQKVLLTMDGAGEIFHSAIYRQIFEKLKYKDFSLWPNVEFVLCTNGTMMTPKIQNKYSYLLDKAHSYRFSIDAGNEKSYNIVRKGGNWNSLWDNVNHLYNTRIEKTKLHWAINLVLQKDNYESIPELIEIAKTYDVIPDIYITNVLDWGSQSTDIYNDMAVWMEHHNEHDRMKQILALPEVVNYPKIVKPF